MDKKDVRTFSSLNELGVNYLTTSTHYRFNCPYCLEKRGKVDNDYKLYIHQKKFIGFCFKCQTVVVKGDRKLDENTVFSTYLSYVQGKGSEVSYKIGEYPYSLDLVNELNKIPDCVEYLKGRGLNDEIIKYWDFRSLELMTKKYIFVPDKLLNNFTNYYQFREIIPKPKPKYVSAIGNKPLMKLSKHNYEDLILVEGIFDATAIGVTAIPLLGKSISSYQKILLYNHYDRNKYPKRVYINLDGGCEKDAALLFSQIRDVFFLKSRIYRIDLPEDYDPEEIKPDYKKYFDSAKKLL